MKRKWWMSPIIRGSMAAPPLLCVCEWINGRQIAKHLAVSQPRAVQYLGDSGQGAVGSIRALLVREPPAAKAVHGVGGDGVAELLEGVVPVSALFDLMEQLGQLACHCIVWGEEERRRWSKKYIQSFLQHQYEASPCNCCWKNNWTNGFKTLSLPPSCTADAFKVAFRHNVRSKLC